MASSGLTLFCHMYKHHIDFRDLSHLLLLARAHPAHKYKGQCPLGHLPSVHTGLNSCTQEEVVWDGPVFQVEAVTLLTSQVVICSECEISHFQLHVTGMS